MYTRFQPILATILLLLMNSIAARGAVSKVEGANVNIAQCRSSLALTHESAFMQRSSACLSCHLTMTKAEKYLHGASGFAGLHVDIIASESATWVPDTCAASDFFSREIMIARTEPALLNVSMGIVNRRPSNDFVVLAFWFLGLAAIGCLQCLAKLNLSRRRSRAYYFSKRPTRILHMSVLLALAATAALLLPRANAVSASVIAAQWTLDAANIANSALYTSIQVAKAATESATLVRRYLYIYANALLSSIHTSIYLFDYL